MNKNIGYLIIVLIVIVVFISAIPFVAREGSKNSRDEPSSVETFSSGAELISYSKGNRAEQEFVTPEGILVQKRIYDVNGLVEAIYYDESGGEVTEEEWFDLGIWEYFITE